MHIFWHLPHQPNSQNSIISFEYVDFKAKDSKALSPRRLVNAPNGYIRYYKAQNTAKTQNTSKTQNTIGLYKYFWTLNNANDTIWYDSANMLKLVQHKHEEIPLISANCRQSDTLQSYS